MKKQISLIPFILLFLLSSCRAPLNIRAERQRVLKTVEAFDNAFIREDRDLFLTAITAQPELIAFGAAKGERHLSRQALIDAYDREVASTSILRLDRTPLAVRFSPDGQVAWVVCLVTGEVQFGEQTVTIPNIRSTIVLEKQQGRWAIVHTHTSIGFEP